MNYSAIIQDESALRSIGLTLLFAAICVPLKIAAALIVALLLTKPFRGSGIFQTLYYLPSILGGAVAASVLWKALFRDNGIVNLFFDAIGLPQISWLSNSGTAMAVLILLRVWEFGSPMLLFLAALRQIPRDLLDAARIDGANSARIFLRIKLPMFSPVLFYNVMLGFCAALQEFNAPYVITGGGPRGATTLLSLLLYRRAFTANEMGYACALSWIMFLMTAAISALFLLFRRKYVFYPDGGETPS